MRKAYELFITCQRTAFHDDGVNKLACAEIVENNVCPADFLTGALGSIHSSPETHGTMTIKLGHMLYHIIVSILTQFGK